jgi:hypothetical protein
VAVIDVLSMGRLLCVVPCRIGIKIRAEGRGQHGRGEVFGLFTARLGGHAVSVQLRNIPVHVGIGRPGQTEAGVDTTPEFIGLRSGQDAEGDVPGPEHFDRLLANDNFAVRRQNG